MIKQCSLFLPQQDHQLHLRHISPKQAADKAPVLMVHGAMEDGRIFYTESGKGLACFLARQGHPVYVLDLRARGKSTPSFAQDNQHGQYESIAHTIPAAHRFVIERHKRPIHWIAHSWGGVLMASALIRSPELSPDIASQTWFGTKRSIRVWNFERLYKVELIWKRLAPLYARYKGYFPFKELGLGADNESYLSISESAQWVHNRPWIDPRDQFDYGSRAKDIKWPPIWSIAAKNDTILGNPSDVEDFLAEVGQGKLTLLSKDNGNAQDYDHINMLTHSDAVHDHFVQIAQFLQANETSSHAILNE